MHAGILFLTGVLLCCVAYGADDAGSADVDSTITTQRDVPASQDTSVPSPALGDGDTNVSAPAETDTTIPDTLVAEAIDSILDSLVDSAAVLDSAADTLAAPDTAARDSAGAGLQDSMNGDSGILGSLLADTASTGRSPDTFYAHAHTGKDSVTRAPFFVRVSRFLKLDVIAGWLASHFLYILLMIVVAVAAWLGFSYVHTKRDKKRFLTRMRLSIMDKEVQKASRYIEKLYYLPHLTPAIICEDLVTGESFLQSLFQKELGMSIEEFIGHVRINRAKNELYENPDASAEDIAHKVGFENTTDFYSAFATYSDNLTFEEFRQSVAAHK